MRGGACACALLLTLGPSLATAGYIDHFATRDDIGKDKAPHFGTSHVLVLPVIVDEPGLPSEQALLQTAQPFFDPLAADGFTFSNYFRVASLGRFEPVTTIAPAVRFSECPFARDANGVCTIERGDVSALGPAVEAMQEILERADANIDFSQYDLNGAQTGESDGIIDGFVLLTNINFGGIALPLARICELAVVGDLYCREQGGLDRWEPVYDDVLVPWVAVSGSRSGQVDFAAHVSVHEFGHLLGFADLYDESGQTTDMPYSFMGGWYYDDMPDMPDAFSRYVIGWANPIQATGDATVTLRPAASSGDVLKLGTGREFFLVENRQAVGPYDGSIAEPGLVIFHVNLDERPSADPYGFVNTITNCVNCQKWRPMLMVEQADGLYELQSGPWKRDDSGDLFRSGDTFPEGDGGAPLSEATQEFNANRYDGSATDIAVTNVARLNDGEGQFSIAVEHPVLEDACADLYCPTGMTCEAGRCLDVASAEPDAEASDGDSAEGSAAGDDDASGATADAGGDASPDAGGSGSDAGDPAAAPSGAESHSPGASDAGSAGFESSEGLKEIPRRGCAAGEPPWVAAWGMLWLFLRSRRKRSAQHR